MEATLHLEIDKDGVTHTATRAFIFSDSEDKLKDFDKWIEVSIAEVKKELTKKGLM